MKVGEKVTLIKDANLKYDSYGSGRPDGKSTKTLTAGTFVEITNLVTSPKPGQTHPVHVNNAGWIEASAVEGEPAAKTPASSIFSGMPSKPMVGEKKELAVGMKGVLVKDANLKYDSYGSGRPDGKSTKTLPVGTEVEITHLVKEPKPGQTHTVHVNGVGWIEADAIKF